MPVTFATSGVFDPSSSSTTHTQSIAINSNAAPRKVIVAVGRESGFTVTGVTYNGDAMVSRVALQHTTNSAVGLNVYEYDVPSGTGAGSYNAVVSMSAATANITILWWVLEGAATGAPEATATNEVESATSINNSITPTAGAGVLGVAHTQQTAGTYSWTNLTTRTQSTAGKAWTTGTADDDNAAAGARTVTASHTASANRHLLALLSYSESSSGGGSSSPAFDDTAFNTDAFSADAFDLGASGPAAPSAGGFRLRRAPRGGQ